MNNNPKILLWLSRRLSLGFLLALLLSPQLSLAQTKPDWKFLSVRIDRYDTLPAFGLLVGIEDSTLTLLDHGDLMTRQTYAYDDIVRIIYFKKGSFAQGFLIGMGVALLPALLIANEMIDARGWYPASFGVAGGFVLLMGGGVIGGLISSSMRTHIQQDVYGDLELFKRRDPRISALQMTRSYQIRKTDRGSRNMAMLVNMEVQ